ncbi:AbrB/MazE/SpoVT family DNA-binding domain-containing protein [Sulfuracidifex metallicus]|uniref:AbrB/MazE/SpoVT family DNA-binding domain-containing protein n=1 Tax=Sulfuracidifex metallicus TaxID=47303 RepID=UPI000A8E4A7D
MTLRVEVGKKGYIIIPKNVRELVGIKEGDTLILTVSGNRIILESEKRIDKEEIIKNSKSMRRSLH